MKLSNLSAAALDVQMRETCLEHLWTPLQHDYSEEASGHALAGSIRSRHTSFWQVEYVVHTCECVWVSKIFSNPRVRSVHMSMDSQFWKFIVSMSQGNELAGEKPVLSSLDHPVSYSVHPAILGLNFSIPATGQRDIETAWLSQRDTCRLQ